MNWPNVDWGYLGKWFADNVGPAIPYLFSGGFSVWALVLKLKGDAAKRADETAREARDAERELRDEARRKQVRVEQEANELRIETERIRRQSYEKQELALKEERERSAQLRAEQIHHMNGKLQLLENQLGLSRMQSERDALKVENLEERLGAAQEKLNARERDNEHLVRENAALRKQLNEVEAELKQLKGEMP